MSFNVLNRKVHYWAAFVAAGPLLVMITSGLLLQTKKHWAWVQPVEHRGTGEAPSIDLEGILASLKTVPEMKVESWADVNRLDVRPGRGVVKAWLMNGYEVQVDFQTGEVLQVEYRRSDLIETLHDGSWFGDAVKLYVFLPVAVVVLGLWVTGVYLFVLPLAVKWRRTRGKAT